MWLQRFTDYLLRHRWQALALTFAITFVPIIGMVGIIIAALFTLLSGVVDGLMFTMAATLPFFSSLYAPGTHTLSLVIWAAVGVAVLSNLLTYAFAVMLRQHASWSTILQVGTLFGVLVISVVHLFYPNIAGWWGAQLTAYYQQAAKAASAFKSSPMSADMQLEAINITKHYATGVMVAAVLFNAILQLMVARWWQSIVFFPARLQKELHGLRLSRLAGILFILSLVLSYLGNSVVLDIMPVLYILFGAVGLSMIHYAFGLADSSKTWFWLAVLYIILIFALPTSVIFIAMIALFDTWFDLRKRLRKV